MSARSSGRGGLRRSRTGVALMAFLVIAAFFLVTEHTAHVFSALPYLLVLACPLLHLFLHGGHGAHGDEYAGRTTSQPREGTER